MRALWEILAVAVLGYAALCGVLFFFQRSLIYFPQPSAGADPKTTMHLTVPGAELAVSYAAHPGPGALIYFGGNAEDVSADLAAFSSTFPERAVYLMHYRGYGQSTGEPSEKALKSDALALFDHVHAEHPEILVIGRSLGSGIATYLASLRPVVRLVLVTPYDSLEEIAAARFPYIPARWLLLDKFESWRCAPLITSPTVLVEAEDDEVIPRASTERLLAHFRPGVATLTVIPKASHNTVSQAPGYRQILLDLR